MKPKILNLGSGDIKIEGVESHDINSSFGTDHCFDLTVAPYPFEDNSWDEIYLFHTIEHIQKLKHNLVFGEIRRILKPDGVFILSFPEFEIILKNWLENFQGQREHWEHNIYGLQRSPSDFHVCAMDSTACRDQLIKTGFKNIEIKEELCYSHNTVIRCQKGEPQKSYEQVVYEDVIR